MISRLDQTHDITFRSCGYLISVWCFTSLDSKVTCTLYVCLMTIAAVPLSRIFFRLFAIEEIEQSETDQHGNRFSRKLININYIMVLTICIFLGNCSHCIVLNPQLPCIVRKVSVNFQKRS